MCKCASLTKLEEDREFFFPGEVSREEETVCA